METTTTIVLREGDVYAFRYNEEYMRANFEPYHCFDGQLVVVRDKQGDLYLRDTYWGDAGHNRRFTLEEALEKGHLGLKCNLNEVVNIPEWEMDYYDDRDLCDLSTQHGCRPRYVRRKDAERSAEKMRAALLNKIRTATKKIEWLQQDIGRAEENLKKLDAGDTTIYL